MFDVLITHTFENTYTYLLIKIQNIAFYEVKTRISTTYLQIQFVLKL